MFKMNTRSAGMAQREMEELKRRYEESPEYLLGAEIIDSVTDELGCSVDEAYAMLTAAKRPLGREAVCARAARELAGYEQGNGEGSAMKLLEDEEFLRLIVEMPVSAAMRVYFAEREAAEANEKLATAQERGRSDILEKIKSRREMPTSVRTAAAAAVMPDFSGMTSEEFQEMKERLRR